jgi:hypothetical protein
MGNLEVRQKLGKNWADEVKVWTDGTGAALLMAGAAWSMGNTLQPSPWDLAPKLSNFKPDPKDTAFYYCRANIQTLLKYIVEVH